MTKYNALIRQIENGAAFNGAFYEKIPDETLLRRYAAWNAAEALRTVKTPVDPRSWAAVEAAVQYADGKITSEELRAAYYAAADYAAYCAADYAAAHSAARSAAYVSASYAAHSAAYYAAYSAAYRAAGAIGGNFAVKQRSKLVAMLRGESFTLEDLHSYRYFSRVCRALRGEL